MVYIATVSGGFSAELEYDANLINTSQHELPNIQYASSSRLYLLMYNRPMSQNSSIRVEAVQFGRKIFLNNKWDKNNISHQSQLLHELVHYMQNENGLHYNCAGDKERLAYYIQEKWLNEVHDISLYKGADISPMVMVMAMSCPLPETFAKNGQGGP